MNRKEFIAKATTLGALCCSAGATLSKAQGNSDPTVEALRNKIHFMQIRMAKLVSALDGPTRKTVLETMGRECAKEFSSLITPYIGKPEEFLEEARRQWMEKASYEKETGTIRILDRASTCTCAFVNPEYTPSDFCACTLGWQKEAYSTILGEPVDAELESSILSGDRRCSFKIQCSKRTDCHTT